MRKVLILLLAAMLLLLVGQVFGAGTTFKAWVKNDSSAAGSSYFTINLYCTNHDSIFPGLPNRMTWVSPFSFNGNISISWLNASLTNDLPYTDSATITEFAAMQFFSFWDMYKDIYVESWADGLPDRFSLTGIANNNGFPPTLDSCLTLSWHARTTNDSGYFCVQKGNMNNNTYDWLFDNPQPNFAMQCWNIQADTFRVFDFSVPIFDTIFDTIRVLEGGNLTIPGAVIYELGGGAAGQGSAKIKATDPGKTLTLSYYPMLPRATLTVTYNGTDSVVGRFEYNPDFTDFGYHTVNLVTSNGVLSDTEIVVIHVLNANAPPVLDSIVTPQDRTEHLKYTLTIMASDADWDSLSFLFWPPLEGATIAYETRTSAIFEHTPTESQGGNSYDVWFIVHDHSNPSWGWDSQQVVINVAEANGPPILTVPADQRVKANSTLEFSVAATDPENDALILTTAPLPTGALFVDNGNGNGSFTWTPSGSQGGAHIVSFYATDGFLVDSDRVNIYVDCCDLPGDADNNGAVNALDVTYLINYLYKHGAAPPCLAEGSANGNAIINSLDVTYLINFLYKHGPTPKCL